MNSNINDVLGWIATAVFAGSYFAGSPGKLRRLQMVGALLWVAYGVLVQALPVVAANLLVLAAAAWTARREPSGPDLPQGERPSGPREKTRTSASPQSSPLRRSMRSPSMLGSPGTTKTWP